MPTMKTTAIAAGAFLLPVVLIAAVIGGIAAVFGDHSRVDCSTVASTTTGVVGYDPDQMANAATIVAVGRRMSVPVAGWVVAIATAMQESGLRNLDYGDRDSLGLFQQRPSQGWGTPAQIMNPTYAATQFYEHLLAVPDWRQKSLSDAAQAVQRSGFPDAYAQHEHAAQQIVAAVHDATCTVLTTGDCHDVQAPNAVALAAINYACGQRGLPYVWGGNGPDAGHAGFDCSGLTKAAYAAAGISLPRTAQTQYDAGPRAPHGAPLLPGDLVFYGTEHDVRHVGLYLGAGLMINAPDFGQVVQSEPYERADYLGATRPTGFVAA